MTKMQKFFAHCAALTFAGVVGLAGCASAEQIEQNDEAADLEDVAEGGEEETGEAAQAFSGCPNKGPYLGRIANYHTYCDRAFLRPACEGVQVSATSNGRPIYRQGRITSLRVWIATSGWKYCR